MSTATSIEGLLRQVGSCGDVLNQGSTDSSTKAIGVGIGTDQFEPKFKPKLYSHRPRWSQTSR